MFAGFIVNANYIGIGRMYRDRLMELFMPDKEAIRDNQWRRAGNADQFALTKLVRRERQRRSVRCTWSIATWSWSARARTGFAAAAATASC